MASDHNSRKHIRVSEIRSYLRVYDPTNPMVYVLTVITSVKVSQRTTSVRH